MQFVVTAAVTEIFGAFPYPVKFPEYLSTPVDIGFRTYPGYRLFLIAIGTAIAAVLWVVIEVSVYGARLRAAVDNANMARAKYPRRRRHRPTPKRCPTPVTRCPG